MPDTRQPVVWVINEGGHDYSKAEEFGRLMPVTMGTVNVFNPDRLMVICGHRLRMAQEADFVVVSGSPTINAIFIAMWLRRFERINLLQWSHRDDSYKLVTVTSAAIEKQATMEAEPIAP